MLTLFTKSLMPKGINHKMFATYGYRSNGKKKLNIEINTISKNKIRGKTGFKLKISKDKISIIGTKYSGKNTPHWNKADLKSAFERKYPKHLLYVKADHKGRGKNEEFHYNKAWLMQGFSFARFVKLLKEGHVKVNIRIGTYPNNKMHDRNPGFRIQSNRFDRCFAKRKRMM